jgi:MoxR-like ATPase
MDRSSGSQSLDAVAMYKKVKNAVKDAIEDVLDPRKLTLRSCGTRTKDEDLAAVDLSTGYWQDPSALSSKPQRWIIQIVRDAGSDTPIARFASMPDGAECPAARTLGYVNNAASGNCAVVMLRVKAMIHVAEHKYDFPDWEWLLVLVFSPPLPHMTSGDPLSNYQPDQGTIKFGGKNKVTVPIKQMALVTIPPGSTPAQVDFAYADVTEAIANLVMPVSPQAVFDGDSENELKRLADLIDSSLRSDSDANVPTEVAPKPGLLGIPDSVYRQINAALASGKRHFIFYGPPGTGKTTLAEYVAREISQDSEAADSYVMLTASSSWSTQDLIGGYQPLGYGKIKFIPGAMLRNFDKPLVIDELNRCPIDKVIGPLFSVLSGQATTLPYRVKIEEEDSEFIAILPEDRVGRPEHEFAPGPYWRLICTLNTVDKSQLGQISYALSRRFAWIRIGVPADLSSFVTEIVNRESLARGNGRSEANPLAQMWEVVNQIREIGGAPIIDFIRAAARMSEGIDFLAAPAPDVQDVLLDAFSMFILPLLDGIARRDVEHLRDGIAAAWGLDDRRRGVLGYQLAELAL